MRMTAGRALVGLIVGVASAAALAQAGLPQGAVSLVNQDRFGSRVALCAETGQPNVRQGAKTIRATAVWVGEASRLQKVEAGQGACDPAWSPDGRRLVVSDGSAVKVWDLRGHQELLTLRCGGAVGLAMSADGHVLSAATADGLVHVWDASPVR